MTNIITEVQDLLQGVRHRLSSLVPEDALTSEDLNILQERLTQASDTRDTLKATIPYVLGTGIYNAAEVEHMLETGESIHRLIFASTELSAIKVQS